LDSKGCVFAPGKLLFQPWYFIAGGSRD